MKDIKMKNAFAEFDDALSDVIAKPALSLVKAGKVEIRFEDIVDDEPADDDEETFDGVLSKFSQDAWACALGRAGWNQDAKFIDELGTWVFFDGNIFVPDRKLKAYTLIRGFSRARVRELVLEATDDKSRVAAIKQGKDMLQKSSIAAVESLTQSNVQISSCVEDFDKDLFLIGTPGGVVDLKTGEMREGRRSDMITKSTAVTPAEQGSTPVRFLEVLDQVFEGDVEVMGFMQRYLGYALTGCTTEHKIVFCHGGGRNGKGIVINTTFALFGDYGRRIPIETLLKKLTGHPTDLAGLAGARMVVGSEVPAGTTWNEAILKDITGGDPITARKMRQDYFDYIPQFSMFLHGNDQPAFRSVGVSIRERMVLVPFNRTFTEDERNIHLQQELIDEEGPEILRWIIDGAAEWVHRSKGGKSGLGVPAKLKAESAEYFDREDEIKNFIDEELVVDPDAFISSDELHQKFRQWIEQCGGEQKSKREVMKEMRKAGFQDKSTGNTRGLKGIRSKTGLDRREK
ncbi:phage/plasmid primase, P4 family [uncultured Sulfitobacter sp.]|uniref:phage/plasmid primase, P4 family n=1 Tax=uncultured Sulfitobacter sp. TaxID=191468 RepID=UPI0026296F6F|nr:phage/plasmid primase, P4 family [uncultured Sulfitobacter sp.]